MNRIPYSRYLLIQRVREELHKYGGLGTYYLLREEHTLATTLYAMWVAYNINKHQQTHANQRITPTFY